MKLIFKNQVALVTALAGKLDHGVELLTKFGAGEAALERADR